MSTAVATVPLTQEQFQEAMMARMRGLMGELMPQATLEEITKRGVEEAFFKPRVIKRDYGREEVKPAWVNEFIEKELAEQVKAQVTIWLAANQEKVGQIVAATLAAGVTGCVASYFTDAFRGPLGSLVQQINDKLQKLGQGSVSVY